MIKPLPTVLCSFLFSLTISTICFSQTAVAKYPFKTNANDSNGNGYNGTLTGTVNTFDRFSTLNAALQFTSGVSSGTLPIALVTAMQNDFTVGFWFKTSMTGSTGAQWYNGNSLVDAEVSGVANSVLSAAQVSGLYTTLVSFALPVKWESFTAEQKEGKIILKWNSTEEINNDHFDIEDSRDGIHFSAIGSIPAHEAVPQYNFTTMNPAEGVHYYRIKQTDKDGSGSYSKTVIITVRKSVIGFFLQTNPVKNVLVLENTGQQFIQRIQLTDMNGRILRNKPVQSGVLQVQTGISSLGAGYYLLNVITPAGIHSLPVIKQ